MGKIYLITILVCLFSCTKQESTIDNTLQSDVESILSTKIMGLNALSGQVIVMETKTGAIKAFVELERKDNAVYQLSNNFIYCQETGLMHPISLLAALESGKVNLNDTVDTGDGEYIIKNEVMRDHNWKRGGYGKLTLKEGIMVGSNIAVAKTIDKVYGDNPQAYFDVLTKMNYGKPEQIGGIDNLQSISIDTTSLEWFSIGYNQQITPIQILTFYNAIANNGIMVQPQLHKDTVKIINPQIANKDNLAGIRQSLIEVVSKGLGKPASCDNIQVAGMQGSIQLKDNSYAVSFCGYFPADYPEYSMIITIYKEKLPVSGGLMAGGIFKSIVDTLYKN